MAFDPKIFILLYLTNFFQSSAGHSLSLNPSVGPESIAFDCHGRGPYVGVEDGRILKWEETIRGWTQFAVTAKNRNDKICNNSKDTTLELYCGRPLGLQFNKITCELYIADSSFGLMVVGPNGGVATELVGSVAEVPLIFANGLDIDPRTGTVYISYPSSMFHRSESKASLLSGDKTGRLIRYDPSTRRVTVLLQKLAFPNGVAVSRDGTFVLVAETGSGRILRYWLQGPNTTRSDLFIQLSGQPDNIKRNAEGDFWVATTPFFLQPPGITPITRSQALKLHENGSVIHVFVGNNEGSLNDDFSEANEHGGNLWIGSVYSSELPVFTL